MKRPLALAVAAFAGVAQAQQPQVDATVHHTLSWVNSATGGQDPIGPGQSAVLRLTSTSIPGPGAVVIVNNISSSNQTLLTLRGIQQMFLDLEGSNDAQGSWSALLVAQAWDLIGPGGYGTSAAGGAALLNIQAGQFPISQDLINTSNPVVDWWVGMWTPSNYAERTVSFGIRNGSANPSPFASLVLLRQGWQNIGVVHVGTVHNGFSSINIPVIPSPSTLAMLGIGVLAAHRRRAFDSVQ